MPVDHSNRLSVRKIDYKPMVLLKFDYGPVASDRQVFVA
jgi:hypothetical protein